MRARFYALSLGLSALPTTAAGNTPPPPPPDPVALEAARQLIGQLPIEGLATTALSELSRTITDNALAWLDTARPEVPRDGELRRLFATDVELDARAQFMACVPQAEGALAEWFARRISATDLREITTFVSTESGRALTGILAGTGGVASDVLVRCTYEAMFPALPGKLDAAIESDELRRRVNDRGVGPARP